MTLVGRDFLKESDFTADELDHLLGLAARLKIAKRSGAEVPRLVGRQLALIFEKTSTRTKVSFEIAMRDQGGHVSVLDPSTSQIGHKESVADTARVLAELFDAIEYRGADHANLEELASASSVPVYNGLTDDWHPTQMLADFMTMREHAAGPEISYAYVGDARYNMGNSLLVMGAIMGADVRIVAPRGLWPSETVQSLAQERARSSGARITITDDVDAGVKGAQFVHTDIWVSMGEPAEVWAERVALLTPYRVDAALMARTGRNDARFMHCLPAYHDQNTTVGRRVAEEFGLLDGVEVSGEVFESAASIVFEQAQNRMHSIKAVLVATLAGA
jgi:ornithine carbamoyltransferase